jgi:hypothetical protein
MNDFLELKEVRLGEPRTLRRLCRPYSAAYAAVYPKFQEWPECLSQRPFGRRPDFDYRYPSCRRLDLHGSIPVAVPTMTLPSLLA